MLWTVQAPKLTKLFLLISVKYNLVVWFPVNVCQFAIVQDIIIYGGCEEIQTGLSVWSDDDYLTWNVGVMISVCPYSVAFCDWTLLNKKEIVILKLHGPMISKYFKAMAII